jgi:uncharacterized GH25 family protein
MKRATAAGLGLGTVVVAAAAWFLLRGHETAHDTERPSDPSAAKDTGRAKPRRPDVPLGQGAIGGDLPVLIDDDPAGGLRLEGQVLGDGDKPVGGATVVLSANPPRTTTSEADGSFAFDGLVGRPYTLIARAPGGVAGPVSARLTQKTEPVILRLRPAGTIAVTVVDPKQQPVAGATVELRGTDTQDLTTDGKGTATFTPVVPGAYDVVADAPGFARAHTPVRLGEEKAEVTLALARGAKVSGKVVDDQGAPVAGARVVYSGASDWSTQGDERKDGVVTAKDGRFELAALPAGSWRFVARHPDHAPGTSALITLDGVTPRDGVEIRLAPGATVRGHVVDTSGAPVASARVRIGLANASWIGEGPRQVYSDDHGEFIVRGVPRRPLVAIAIAEDAASDSVAVDTTGGDANAVILKLDVTGTIAGAVVDQGGAPLEGVQVSAFPDFRAAASGGGDMAQWRLRGFPEELTDAAGHFTLTGLAKGTYRVRATRSQHASRGRGFAGEGTSAETGTKDLKIVLPPEGSVKGKVAFADGAPVGPYTVSVGFTQQPAAASDGSFLLDGLTPDHYTLTVRGNFASKSVDVDVKGAQTTDAGTIVVEKGRFIGGKVVANGQPVPGATVYAGRQIFGNGSSSDARFGGGPPFAQGTRHTTTGEDGSFQMSGFGLGDVTIVAEEPNLGRSPGLRLIAGDPNEQNLTLVIQPYGALHGTLRSGGNPAENVIVTAQSATSPGAIYSVATGPDGSYRFDKLAPDTYKVSATIMMPMRGMRFYSKSIAVPSAQDVALDLQYDPGAVTLQVTGVPAKGAKMGFAIYAIATGTINPKINRELNAQLAAQGQGFSGFNFVPMGRPTEFDQLDPGAYTVCATPLPAGIEPMKGMAYFEEHGDTLPVSCKPVTVAASPAVQTMTLEVVVPTIDGSGGGSGTGSGGPKPSGR